jgi:hypothetical protein
MPDRKSNAYCTAGVEAATHLNISTEFELRISIGSLIIKDHPKPVADLGHRKCHYQTHIDDEILMVYIKIVSGSDHDKTLALKRKDAILYTPDPSWIKKTGLFLIVKIIHCF